MSIASPAGPDEGWTSILEDGHRLRRQDAHAEALARYLAAAAEAPALAVPHLHRGHALRLLGRSEEAEAAYRLAAMLDPLDPAATAALAALRDETEVPGAPLPPTQPITAARTDVPDRHALAATAPDLPAPAPAASPVSAPPPAIPLRRPGLPAPAPRPRMAMMRAGAAAPRRTEPPAVTRQERRAPETGAEAGVSVAYDVSDLLLHFGHTRTPTGIQRVQTGVLRAALRRGAKGQRYVAFDPDRAVWREVPSGGLADLLDLSAAGGDPEDDVWVEARDGLLARLAAAPPASFPAGGVLANLGNSWGLPDYFRGLRHAQRDGGALYVPFLHDCVPLLMPEHCVRTLVEDYARWFGGMALHAHAVLCNSESTRADGVHHLAALGTDADIPIHVVRLDADPRGTARPDRAALAALGGPSPDEPYVLFVATIEARKDHETVFRAWRELIRRHGAAVPRLVCVGAPGWHAEAALRLLETHRELAEAVTLMRGVSDGALAALYEGCQFTVYNSHHEGWGLPVTESIAWGKVPVVPRHSGLIESGGEAAVFFAPGAEGELVAAVERLALDPDQLAAAERRLNDAPPPRPWEVVEAEVMGHLRSVAAGPARPPAARAAVLPGVTLRTRRERVTRPALDLAVAESVREGPGWHVPDDWGCWSRGGRAGLRLPVDASLAGGTIRVALEMRLPEGLGEVALRVGLDAAGGRIPAGTVGDVAVALTLEVPEGTEEVSLTVESETVTAGEDARSVGAGLRGVMLCREDDLDARLRFLEAQRLAAGP